MRNGDCLTRPTDTELTAWLSDVPDPEIPVISIMDLGIVRGWDWDGNTLKVAVTPTYSGCPATKVIANDIKSKLHEMGVSDVRIIQRLSPAWTTDWLSDDAKLRLKTYGIAPPVQTGTPSECPRCDGTNLEKVSQFGSTPCKAQWRCKDCLEPFDYFKCI